MRPTNEGIPEMQAASASASSGSPLQECQCPHPRALPYTKMASFKIKHYDLPKSSMDFFWIELSLTMSQSCLEFNWWAIGEGLLEIGSKYRVFQPRKMHQKCQKVASLVECFSITLDFGHLYNFLFSRYSLRVFRYAFDIFGSPSTTHFLSFCRIFASWPFIRHLSK